MMSKRFFVLYKNVHSRPVYKLTTVFNEYGKNRNKYTYNKDDSGGHLKKLIVGSAVVAFGYYLTGGWY